MSGIQENQTLEDAQSVSPIIGIEKRCNTCGEVRPLTDFWKQAGKRKDGRRSNCIYCVKEYCKKWRENNPEKNRKRLIEYLQNNPTKKSEYGKQYYSNNKEKILTKRKIYAENNKEYKKEYNKKYAKGLITKKDTCYLTLGFIPLNKWFKGAASHHIDKDHIIYIPEDLHRSVGHNLRQNRNMEKINTLAWNFLIGE